MSEYDFKPEDDTALTERVGAVIDSLWERIGKRDPDGVLVVDASNDPLIADVALLLERYHEELIMRRQDARMMSNIIEAYRQEIARRAA